MIIKIWREPHKLIGSQCINCFLGVIACGVVYILSFAHGASATWTGLWPAAHGRRQVLLDYITRSGGLATLMDYRRTNDYDSDKLVDQYLNQLEVKVMHAAGPPTCLGLP